MLPLAGQNADEATWERIHELAQRTTDTEQKDLLCAALAATRDEKLWERALSITLGEELPAKQSARLVHRVAKDGDQPEQTWDFAKANLPALLARTSVFEANRFVPLIFIGFSDAKRAAELEAFAATNLPPQASRPVALAVDEIRFLAAFRTRALREAAAWIAEEADAVVTGT